MHLRQGLVGWWSRYRLAGVYSPGNGEFSTQPFPMPSTPLWLNAEATWGSWSETGVGPWQPFLRRGREYDGNYVGGADEGRAAVSSAQHKQNLHPQPFVVCGICLEM
jgi:hypothetical protein